MKINCTYTRLATIESLTPHPKNTNKHPERQIKALARLISARGWRHPIIVSKRSGFIVAGHGRLLAAIELGLSEVPVDEQDFATEADEYFFLESDNHIARYAEFDSKEMLTNLEELSIDTFEFDFEEIGLFDFRLDVDDIPQDDEDDDDEKKEKKYILEVQLPNELDLRDLYDDLISKGYMVKER